MEAKLYHQTPTGQMRVCNAKRGRCPYGAEAHMTLTADELVAKREAIAGSGVAVKARAKKPKVVPETYGLVAQPGETRSETRSGTVRFTKADGSWRHVGDGVETFQDRRGQHHRTDGPAVVWADGTKHWLVNGELHREDGPAVEWADGSRVWYVNGKQHREDGPAVEWADGSRMWCVNGNAHRLDGPAFEGADGTKEYWVNNKRHREDGPAILLASGTRMWYVNDKLHNPNGPAVVRADGSQEFWVNGVRVESL